MAKTLTLSSLCFFLFLSGSISTANAKNIISGKVEFSVKGQEKTVGAGAQRSEPDSLPILVEYRKIGQKDNSFQSLPLLGITHTGNGRILNYEDQLYQVVLRETDREDFTEITGEMTSLDPEGTCLTLRVSFPVRGEDWKWFSGLENSVPMVNDSLFYDTVAVETVLPPDGAFNGKTLAEGGYGDPVGLGTMSYYPLSAIKVDKKGEALGIDPSLPLVFRLSSKKEKGLIVEFDLATSPLTLKFPNRSFFRLSRFSFDPEWGMRAALREYYDIYPKSFKKRVITEGIWLPFTPLRSIAGWKDFGFAFHEISWGSRDIKEGKSLPTILSDKGTGVLSFQYTEPWDVQLPIVQKEINYDSIESGTMISEEHAIYLKTSATEDKNDRWQVRRLKTPWFESGWAMSITTNSDPDIKGFNRYDYVRQNEINPALEMNVDGIYFDSMEWNWHHDLNYRKDHFKYTDYPLTFSKEVGRPAIWHFTSEYELMEKIADQMHVQGKLVMGNGHGWNPFAAVNLDLFGAELSWYSEGAHNSRSLDFKRAISFQKPIVFLLNEGLNDDAFNVPPYHGYQVYFEKLMAYGFFPSFFSVDASSDPYWQDKDKIENGRPFFKKYIPVIKQLSSAGWEPVSYATVDHPDVRVERFGNKGNLYFTIRNNGKEDLNCTLEMGLDQLGLEKTSAYAVLEKRPIEVKKGKIELSIPMGRTKVIRIFH